MFPSSDNGSDPISFSDQQAYNNRHFFNDIIPNSKQEELPFSLFHFPSPFIQYDVELEDHDIFLPQNHDLLLYQQLQPLRGISTSSVPQTAVVNNMVDSNKTDVIEQIKVCNKKSHNSTTTDKQQIPRKRSSKRDRHSKIHTAQGPRDRRMRLSLKVAREFFDLQDKLGFDKASKTVEWLLIQAKHEIKKLSSGLLHPQMNYSCSIGTKSASSTSECEVVSGIDETTIGGGSISRDTPSVLVRKEKKTRPSRKAAFHPLARESREKARARARERTREKLWNRRIDESKLCEEATNHEFHQLGCLSPFETGEESGSQSHNMNNPCLEVLAEVEAPSSHEQEQLRTPADGIIDESMGINIMGKWSPSSIFNHLHNNGIPQDQHQLTDFQSFFHKSWDLYNIQSL